MSRPPLPPSSTEDALTAPTVLAAPAAAVASDPTRTSEPVIATTAPGAPRGGHAVVETAQRDPRRYHILGEHGRGGLGRVSRAHDHELGRDVAIKELIVRGGVHEVRFLREALITARLEHPGIVPVHEAGRWPDGTPFYAMKLVSGRPLRDLIAERTTVDARLGLLHHVIAVAHAIAYAHGRNIIHRDLKPANVIVGEFGETIVIDWGLAKDLSSSEPSLASGEPVDPHAGRRDDELTTTGSVLGTPAYMAPEQERGEPADRRADVFAIGAMLWELCALHRVPPAEARDRDRALRRAGIDDDLATIIGKALAHDPDQRYPDAGALAADLKAFTSGARIAARRYSLVAMLAHWTRRHRALAASVVAVTGLAAAGTARYVRDVAVERNLAGAAAARAESANRAMVAAHAATEAANHDLSLKNAELLLASDPTAAWEALAAYHGPDQVRAELLRAKARGLGIAKVRASVHKDTVYRMQPLSDGTLLSVSEDGTVAATTVDGSSRVLARDATGDDVSSFARDGERLAYACQPTGICVLDPLRGTTATIASELGVPGSLAFSPDARHLAARYGDHIVVWNATAQPATAALRTQVAGARALVFASSDQLIVITAHQARRVSLHGGLAPAAVELTATAYASTGDELIAGNDRGEIVRIGLAGWPRVARRAVCDSQINGVIVLPARRVFAYACQDGAVGIRALDDDRLITHYHQDTSVLSLASSADERDVVTGGQGGTMRIYDLVTDSLTRYNGHLGRLDMVSGPSPEFPYFASGDDDGYIRIWGRPPGAAHTIARGRSPLYDALILDDATVLTAGDEGILRWWRPAAAGEIPAHPPGAVVQLRRSPDPAYFATWSFAGGEIAVWDAHRLVPLRRFAAGSLVDVRFLSDGVSLVTSGEDGRLLVWSPDRAEPRLLVHAAQPLGSLLVLPGDDAVIVADRAGAISRFATRAPAPPRELRAGHGDAIPQLIASDDGRWLAVGTAGGEVAVYSTSTWQPTPVMQVVGAVHQIALSPDGSLIAVVSESGQVRLAALPGATPPSPPHWQDLAVPARSAKFSPDGATLAIMTVDGGALFYAVDRRTWRYVELPGVSIFGGRFSPDSLHYVALDSSARATLFDLARMTD